MEKLSNDGKNISASGIIFGSLIAQRGPRGEQGIQGVQGDKPVKGIDYFTEEDKEEIVQETSVIVNERFTPEFEQMQKDVEGAIKNINDMKEAYNNNASEKTAEFNTNAENKINEYNANAENLINKTDELKLENTRLRNQIPTGSAEGESITLNDSSNLSYKKFNICGKSVQNGTPTPEVPVEIHSLGDDVNLFDKNTAMQGYIDYNNGQFTSINTYTSSDFIEISENENYYCNYVVYNSSTYGMAFYDKDKNYISGSVLANSFVTPNNAKYYRFCVRNNNYSSGSYITDINTIKLQKGTVATPYSEYGKGTVEIKQSGKNLFNIETVEKGKYYDEKGSLNNYNNAFCKKIKINANDKYNIYIKNNYSSNIRLYIFIHDKNNNKINYIIWGESFATNSIYKNNITMPSNAEYITISILDVTQENIKTIDIQLEKNIFTEYESYKGNNYVIPLSQPLRSLPNGVKDTIEEDGIHRRVGSVVFDGSSDEGWTLFTYGTAHEKTTMFVGAGVSDMFRTAGVEIDFMCDLFTAKSNKAETLNTDSQWIIHAMNNNFYICIENEKASTLDEFKTWLLENNVKINYQLAEEVIEPLTEEQKAVIDEIYNTGTVKGVTNISSSSLIEPEFDIEYYKDLEILFNNLSQAIIGGN